MKYKTVRTYVDKEVVVTYVLENSPNTGYLMYVSYAISVSKGREQTYYEI